MLTGYLQTPARALKISQTVASISFFLLFPGFLFYHQFVAMELIPPFAKGLFGYTSLGTVMILFALLPWNVDWLRKVIKNRYIQWALIFLIYTSVWTIVHYLLLSESYITKASIQSVETIILWACLFFVGLLLPLESKTLQRLFFISFVIILSYLAYYSISTGSIVYVARKLYGNSTDISSYQGFARSVLIILLFLMAFIHSARMRAFYILGGIFVLFLLASRSEFYAFLALSFTLCIIWGIRNPKYLLILLFASLELLILAKPVIAPQVKVLFPSKPANGAVEVIPSPTPSETQRQEKPAVSPNVNRQLQVLDLPSTKSWISRQYLQKVAVEQIMENPLIGKFGGHVTGNHTGRYAHNALSAWVTYGLVGFLLYISLAMYGFLVAAREVILKQQATPIWAFAFTLNFVCLLLIIVSKSVYWPLPALAWGVLAQALVHQANQHD